MRSILYYITGHGYGHAVRSSLVIRALKLADAEIKIYVRSPAPQWLFDSNDASVFYTHQLIDVGLIQPDSLQIDLPATLRACRDLHQRFSMLLQQEIRFIEQHEIGLIVGDIPPLGFEIAARAGIPSVALTNFTWDVVYRTYATAYPDFTPLVEEMTQFYGKTSLALTLPYPCDMSMFPRREEVPWIARASKLTRHEARMRFGIPAKATVVLLSFGGLGLDTLPWPRLRQLSNLFFVTTGAVAKSLDNLLALSDVERNYDDLLRAVDVIVTKPGYGIVADILSHHLPVLYTDRGEFPEYPHLVQALTELATAEHIPQAALTAGDLEVYLEKLLARPPHWPSVSLDGAATAAKKILPVVSNRGD